MPLNQFRSQFLIWDKAHKEIYEKVEANAGDSNGRKLVVQVVNDGVVEDLTGSSLNLSWRHEKNNTNGLDNFTMISESRAEFEIYYKMEMLSNVPSVRASLQLTDSTGIVETNPFDIHIQKSNVDNDAVQSSNSFTALAEALQKVQTLERTDGTIQLAELEDNSVGRDTLTVDFANNGRIFYRG